MGLPHGPTGLDVALAGAEQDDMGFLDCFLFLVFLPQSQGLDHASAPTRRVLVAESVWMIWNLIRSPFDPILWVEWSEKRETGEAARIGYYAKSKARQAGLDRLGWTGWAGPGWFRTGPRQCEINTVAGRKIVCGEENGVWVVGRGGRGERGITPGGNGKIVGNKEGERLGL